MKYHDSMMTRPVLFFAGARTLTPMTERTRRLGVPIRILVIACHAPRDFAGIAEDRPGFDRLIAQNAAFHARQAHLP
jgi:hypothetical protein